MTQVLERRVDRLDDALAELARAQAETQRELQRLSFEMREFKGEMRDFKGEMQDFKDWSKQQIIEGRKQWGELSMRLGTMAEDLVAPSVPRVLRTVIDCPDDGIDWLGVRVRIRSKIRRDREREFDVVAVCGDHVLINETKTRLTPEAIKAFAEMLPTVRDYFPEHVEKHFIGAVASLYVDESLVRHGERLGLIVLGFGEDVMDVLNTPGFAPREF